MDGGLWCCTGDSDQDHPQEKEIQKAKWLSEEALQTAKERREATGKEENKQTKKIHPSECRVPTNSKKREPSSVINAKK